MCDAVNDRSVQLVIPVSQTLHRNTQPLEAFTLVNTVTCSVKELSNVFSSTFAYGLICPLSSYFECGRVNLLHAMDHTILLFNKSCLGCLNNVKLCGAPGLLKGSPPVISEGPANNVVILV